MKVIFLDFDGVLNSNPYLVAQTGGRICADSRAINPKAVQNLNVIINKTNALVVISSSWRHFFSLSEIKRILVDRGFCFASNILDKTPSLSTRENEIQAWLREHPEVTNFVILDDIPMKILCQHAVTTTMRAGLTQKHVNKAVKILSKG
jgi:hypothetical protein